MAFIPNVRKRLVAATSFPFIDNLFDYGTFLRGAVEGIGMLPPGAAHEPLAVVGSGIAGLVAAYELLRAGARNLTIFEADARIGGRAYSSPFTPTRPEFLAELGAMRFPPTEFGLFHYLDRFQIPYTSNFPDPGKVFTNIGYQGQTYSWSAGKAPPELFTKVNSGWNAFVAEGFAMPDGSRLLGPAQITALLQATRLGEARVAWQSYIDLFERTSFYQGLVQIFMSSRAPGGVSWNAADFQLFGALGLGSGGFGPLYQIGFVELIRLIVNELETDQKFVPSGIQSLATAFAKQTVSGIRLGQLIKCGAPVQAIAQGANNEPLLTVAGGRPQQFARVIVATSNRSMQIEMGLSKNLAFFDAQQYTALNSVHMTSSSKVFVMTKNKFWLLNAGIPANIQTDTLVRGVYCLDYTENHPNDPGVVLLSYTWEDDSVKQLALSEKEARVKRLVADVAQTNAAFASHVVPLNNDYRTYVQMVDWDLEPHYYGAFKLNYPGDDGLSNALFFQYLSCARRETDKFLYLAGDSASYNGGWMEGAVQTGVNAACAVIRSLGGSLYSRVNPIDSQDPRAYNYYP
jgi:tryptophan 2-monooxygenase